MTAPFPEDEMSKKALARGAVPHMTRVRRGRSALAELVLEFVLDRGSVRGPDLIAQVVDQREHGERGLGGPVVWDREEPRLKPGRTRRRHEG